MSDLEIEYTEEDIINMNKLLRKKYVHCAVKEASQKYLLEKLDGVGPVDNRPSTD